MKMLPQFNAALSVLVVALSGWCFIPASPALGQETGSTELPSDLTNIGLDKLLNFDLVVTTPARKEQKLTDTASAVYVLTGEDIRRSGATHVAEALRLVPGVNVARVSSNRWAISIRGFNQVFSNKLLVLIDGVSVFSPTTNGVYWESNEIVLEDIDRIEVVRGPGGALWGSNAVNGVINIVTKESKTTQGWLVSGGGGSQERTFGTVRYGDAISDTASYRLYSTYHDRGNNRELGTDESANDSWQSREAGFRMDAAPSPEDEVVLSGVYQYQTDKLLPAVPSLDPPFVDDISYRGDSSWRGARVAGEWRTNLSPSSQVESRINYSRKERVSDLISFSYDLVNVDVQHRLSAIASQDLVYGVSYRSLTSESEGSEAQEVLRKNRSTDLASAFFQDEFAIIPDRLRMTLGSKFEYNDLIGMDFMPNGRLLLKVSPSVTAWAAVSRAVAPPAIFFEDSHIPVQTIPDVGGGLPGIVSLSGSSLLDAESLLATEVGMRAQISRRASIDAALFYNTYDDIFSASASNSTPPSVMLRRGRPYLDVPLVFGNELNAHSYGGELATELKVTDDLRFSVSHSYLVLNVDLGDTGDLGDKSLIEDGSPRHQTSVRLQYDLSDEIQTDLNFRIVDSLGFGNVNGYSELEARVGWKIRPNLELAVIGQNLLQSAHQEFQANLFGLERTELERSVLGKVTYTF